MKKLIPALLLCLAAGAADAPAPLDEKSCVDFARELEASFAKQDPSFLNARFRADLVADRAMAGIEAPPDVTAGFRAGLTESLPLAQKILSDMGKGGRYVFLRFRMVDGQPRVFFRLTNEGGDLNYHQLVLSRGPDGKPVVADLYQATTGECLSDTVRRGYLCIAANANRGLISRLVGKESDYVAHFAEIGQMTQHVQSGKGKEAIAVFDALPASLKTDKSVLLLRLNAAGLVDLPSYQAAALDLEKAFPSDPCIELCMLSSFISSKRFDRALQGLDRIEAMVGKDSYLDYQRAEVHFAAGNLPGCKTSAAASIAAEPALLGPHWILVLTSLQEKDFRETARLLTRLESDLGLYMGDLTSVDAYKEFVVSDAYRDWLKTRKPKEAKP